MDLVKRGYTVATLTSTYGITYENAGNPYDLSNYDVFIVDEPNILFTSAEATAIFNYVRDGGGLVAISDHGQSDRNNDGYDSPMIWNAMDPGHLLGVRCRRVQRDQQQHHPDLDQRERHGLGLDHARAGWAT